MQHAVEIDDAQDDVIEAAELDGGGHLVYD
jgi:hypothetical protein